MKARFERLQETHRVRLEEYASLLLQFNRVHNLISRQDTAEIYEHHVVHCLTLAIRAFPAGARIVDWGSGGGLPAIPVAIVEPEARVIAVDAVEKKMLAVGTFSRRLALKNLVTHAGRAEAFEGTGHYSISRATAPLIDLWRWHRRIARPTDSSVPDVWTPGLVALKGGNLEQEIGQLLDEDSNVCVDLYNLASLLEHSYFHDKRLIHVYT
jgi:16S rRNA (guanine527-N7)-methyltransferase